MKGIAHRDLKLANMAPGIGNYSKILFALGEFYFL